MLEKKRKKGSTMWPSYKIYFNCVVYCGQENVRLYAGCVLLTHLWIHVVVSALGHDHACVNEAAFDVPRAFVCSDCRTNNGAYLSLSQFLWQ